MRRSLPAAASARGPCARKRLGPLPMVGSRTWMAYSLTGYAAKRTIAAGNESHMEDRG